MFSGKGDKAKRSQNIVISLVEKLCDGRPGQPNTALIQSLLFFGLASVALGRTVKNADFLEERCEGADQKYIDLRMPSWFLEEIDRRWDRLKDTLSSETYEAKKAKLLERCEITTTIIIMIDQIGWAKENEECSVLLLSIHMLLFLIAKLFDKSKVQRASLECGPTKLLVRRCIDNGWCRKRLNSINSAYLTYPALYFMSSIRPPRLDTQNHELCSSSRCSVQSKLVKALHRYEDCACPDIRCPLDQVIKIVAEGGIPLIRIDSSDITDVKLEVVPYHRNILFTAISHVWADQQLGSTTNALPQCQVLHLDSLLASLPRQVSHWGWRDWLPKRFCEPVPVGSIRPPSRTYEYFWLDTFCIPQGPEHALLQGKAIDSMNLIYATAAQTLVMDAGLQKFDAGQAPASMSENGSATYYGPTEQRLSETIAHICASNWMGRAWTLQEGVLSGQIVFSLKGSLAYLRVLRPHVDSEIFNSNQTLLQSFMSILEGFCNMGTSDDVTFPMTGRKDSKGTPADSVRAELFIFAKSVLNVDEYRNYARGPAVRAARFTKAHSLLQSRSTTQPEDVTLILINMSGMNGNTATHDKSTASRMRSLFYGLESVSTEILFASCTRVSDCDEDSWIPTEIVPCDFSNTPMLQLCSEGWTIPDLPSDKHVKMYSISASVTWQDDVFFSVSPSNSTQAHIYRAKATTPPKQRPYTDAHKAWCIMVGGDALRPRGALFTITRTDGFKVFLHFESSLDMPSIWESAPDSEQSGKQVQPTTPADPTLHFLLERSTTATSLGTSRPQNPEQFSDRLIVVSGLVYVATSHLDQHLRRKILGEWANNWYFLAAYSLATIRRPAWIEDQLTAFVHHAWVQTFQPDWNAGGRWRYFWRAANYEPAVPFLSMYKVFLTASFFFYFLLDLHAAVLAVSAYWWAVYPKRELLAMYVSGVLGKLWLRYTV
ncbi:hypothetical protein ACN47E_006878 [Coniothyrium glycines]